MTAKHHAELYMEALEEIRYKIAMNIIKEDCCSETFIARVCGLSSLEVMHMAYDGVTDKIVENTIRDSDSQ